LGNLPTKTFGTSLVYLGGELDGGKETKLERLAGLCWRWALTGIDEQGEPFKHRDRINLIQFMVDRMYGRAVQPVEATGALFEPLTGLPKEKLTELKELAENGNKHQK
jgi:hypothetical protein